MEIILGAIIVVCVLIGFWKLQQSEQVKANQSIVYGLLSLGVVGFILIATTGISYAMVVYVVALTPVLPFAMRLFQHSYYEQPAYDELSIVNAAALMQREEALQVLGLDEMATADDVKKAHKAMILRVHPDQGGSDYLTQKVNQARDMLIQPRKMKPKL